MSGKRDAIALPPNVKIDLKDFKSSLFIVDCKKLMTSIPKSASQLYEIDFVAWTEETVQLIRAGQFEQVDWDSVIEEIENLGRSDRRELKSHLEVLLQRVPASIHIQKKF